jgi:hypothetical protein
MDNETTAPAPAPAPRDRTQYLPHDLIFQILLHLPVESLMRFTSVCKTWHGTITGDRCFQLEHQCLQEACVLISPRIRRISRSSVAPLRITTPGLYRWEKKKIQQGDDFAATLVQTMESFPAVEETKRHTLAHCHGLVLVSKDGGPVRVLNPATRRVLTLPPSPHGVAPPLPWVPTIRFHRALGLGHDPRSDTYKRLSASFFGP